MNGFESYKSTMTSVIGGKMSNLAIKHIRTYKINIIKWVKIAPLFSNVTSTVRGPAQ